MGRLRLPKKTIVRKNIIDSKLEKGMTVSTAGKTIKARSGPASGMLEIGMFTRFDMYPMKLKMTSDARIPQEAVSSGMITADRLISCFGFL